MLHSLKSGESAQSAHDSKGSQPFLGSPAEHLLPEVRVLTNALTRRKWLIFILVCTFTITSLVASLLILPQYTAKSRILFEPSTSEFGGKSDILSTLGGDQYGQAVDSQVQVMLSTPVIDRVIEYIGVQRIENQLGVSPLAAILHRANRAAFGVRPETPDERKIRLRGRILQSIAASRETSNYVVDVELTSLDAQFSADVVNTVVNFYLQIRQEERSTKVRQMQDLLSVHLEALRANMKTAEQSADLFNYYNNMAETDRDSLNKEMEALKVQLGSPTSGTDTKTQSAAQLVPLPTSQIEASEKPFDAASKLAEAELASSGSKSERFRHQQMLESEASAERTHFQEFLARAKQASEEGLLQSIDSNVFQAATAPVDPSGPNRIRIAVIASAIGFLLAVGAALLLNLRDRARVSPESIRDIGSEVLASLPLDNRMGNKLSRFSPSSTKLWKQEEVAANFREFNRVLFFLGDALRAGRKVFVITSALPKEGKTFLASRLAEAAANSGLRTALIADAGTEFEGKNSFDPLSNVTGQLVTSSDNVHTEPKIVATVHGLTPLGLAIGELEEELSQLKKNFDLIIIDAQAALVSGSARHVGAIADGVIVVAMDGEPLASFKEGYLEILGGGARILGTVVNKVPISE